MNRGHNTAADHWGIGVLIYEMSTKDTVSIVKRTHLLVALTSTSSDKPFYRKGMDQMTLYRTIVKAKFKIPWEMSDGK